VIASLLTRVRQLWNRVEERWQRFRNFFSGPSVWAGVVRWVLAILLFGLAVVFLVFLGWLLRGAGLWGDLAFAILVTTGVFWIARRVAHEWLDNERALKSFLRAFSTTILVLVGIPVAYVTRPVGVVLLLLPTIVWAGFKIATRLGVWHRWRPVFWQAEVAGVAFLTIVLFVAPSVGSPDRVPRAVPAAATEGGEQDLAVAERFRPLLFFDSGEQRFPLDIQDAVDDDRVRICRKAVGDDNCDLVASAESIDANLDYLTLDEDPGTPRGGDAGSAIYYHVTRPGGEGPVYVDYWWFYSRNPSPVADKVFCGPGLRMPPYTCQEHVGDWEGLTLVLAPCTGPASDCETVGDESLAPEEVRYGQHEHVVAYDWNEVLVPFWSSLDSPTVAALAATWKEVVLPAIDEAGARPIAFVARNSHASYPSPCFGGCRQETRNLPEAVHNGAVPWAHNENCDACVQALPLASEGEAALWNAFPGSWGEQQCILAGAYCDLSGAPKGPSFQERYDHPDGPVVAICLSGARLDPC
jgi:hypothetical protein